MSSGNTYFEAIITFSMKQISLVIVSLLIFCSCKTTRPAATQTDDGQIEIVFLQMNDVYEIAPLDGGRVGGLARVATIKNRLLKENPNTFAILAGDFLNPSLINTLKYEGSRISGKQMVEVLNTLGLDIATFGNHEFDIKEAELLSRLQESQFRWVSANVLHKTPDGLQPFVAGSGDQAKAIPKTLVLDVQDEDGTAIKLGILGVTLPSNQVDWVEYLDFNSAAAQAYNNLKSQADVVVALTHIDLEDDIELSKQNPGIRLIMGGHDHTSSYDKVGESYVAKADANARTVYVHKLLYNKPTRQVTINSSLIKVDTTVPFDSATASVVSRWTTIARTSFKEQGFQPDEVVYVTPEPLEVRESHIRHQQTNMGDIITKAMSAAAPQSEVAMVNSGSLRLDDQLTGTISQYDILRTMPFGGKILEADITGELLEKILTTGRSNKGKGGFLQLDKASYTESTQSWLINGQALDKNKTYRVALSDYLLTGMETNFGYLKPGAEGLLKIYEPDAANKEDMRNDIRMAVNAYLKSLKR
jgi:2',3'-cyclic-nucleotide 2'-phosphodiesterase (5'-nucleotidase family)